MYNNQKIAKIEKILDKDPCYKNMQMYRIDTIHQHSNGHFPSFEIYEEDIIKHSPNLIDLIEEGDFVNNRQVLRVFIDPFTKKKRLLIEGTEINWQGDMSAVYCEAENIKSVITKEQIESIKYEV